MKKITENSNQKACIVYVRVSSLDQLEGTSLESQERLCREYADRQGWKVLKVFVERGESAKTVNRTEFNKALEFCRAKKNSVNFFLVYKLDRFARRVKDYSDVKDELRKVNVELVSATEPFSNGPAGIAMEQMLSVFAEFDNNVRRERTTQGMIERMKQGVWVWPCPIGYYRPVKNQNIVPDPATAPLIKLAFEEFAKGIYTFRELAQFLTKRGLRTRYGNKPTHQLVEKVIRNPIYCGIIDAWGQKVPGAFPAIISKELFDRCQPQYQSTHAVPRQADNPLFPLRQFIVCQACKIPYTGSESTGRHGDKYPYYHHHHTKDCPNTSFIPKAAFEQLFFEYLTDISPKMRFEKLFKATVIDIWKKNYQTLDSENAKIRKDIEALEAERQKVFDFHRTGKYTDQEFEEQKTYVNARINEKHLLIQDKRVEEFNMEEALDYCFNFIRDSAKTWKEFKTNHTVRLRFQKRIFTGPIEFDGKTYGTPKLSCVYELNRQSGDDETMLVALRGIEPRFSG